MIDLIRELLEGHGRDLRAHIDQRLDTIERRIETMSENLSTQLDTVSAAIETDVAAVATEVSKLIGELTPGATVTQAQVDRLTAIDTALKAIPPAP